MRKVRGERPEQDLPGTPPKQHRPNPSTGGRAVDPSGSTYLNKKLDNGLSLTNPARLLVASHESAHRNVVYASTEFLGRSPDPSGTVH